MRLAINSIVFAILSSILLTACTKSEDKLLLEAVRNKQVEVVNSLLSRGANVNASNYGRTALMIAIPGRYFASDIFDILLTKGADINKIDDNGYSALHFAIINNNFYAVKSLIAKGSDVNTRVDPPLKYYLIPGFIRPKKGS
jgi:ankyrin repeat protein